MEGKVKDPRDMAMKRMLLFVEEVGLALAGKSHFDEYSTCAASLPDAPIDEGVYLTIRIGPQLRARIIADLELLGLRNG